MNILKKGPTDSTQQSSQEKHGVVIHPKYLSRIVALFLLTSCCVFLGGYFWGQRTAIDQLLNSIERDSFADQVYYSMCAAYDQRDYESNGPDAVRDEVAAEVVQAQNETTACDGIKNKVEPVTTAPEQAGRFYAQLAGFGTQKAAEKLVRKLQSQGILTEVSRRVSKTAKGKTIAWYQVITPDYLTKDSLEATINEIKTHERLHDVRVIKRC
ncbi:SPOR domain-containing protein [Candidatus Babeliales bacterium]|nr:SPOR domain-containing protein [Candidatus Babeliales bacterium]